MGWMQKCCETYENNIHMAGSLKAGLSTLCPPYHIIQKAQLEIAISATGQFVSAAAVTKGDEETVIPVTENSGSRAGKKNAAHMLCDQLKYIAMGSLRYAGYKGYEDCFTDYLNNLKTWLETEPEQKKLRAVYTYCTQGDVISDLSACHLIETDENGLLTDGKLLGTPYEKCLVRWRVIGVDDCDAVWLDKKLFESYIKYYDASVGTEKELCYVSGEKAGTEQLHPKGIVKFSNGAKLISSNDSAGFTYRGRFSDANEALSVGSMVSQKAHSALRWLAANQGKVYGGRCYICWNPKGKYVPPVSFSPYGAAEDKTPDYALTQPQYKERIQKALNGIRQDFSESDDVVLISLDAATTGRLSVTYYNELKASDFLDRLQRWYERCCWFYTRYGSDKKLVTAVDSPSLLTILNHAYGTEQGGMLKADDKVIKDQYLRVLRCIADAQPLPPDMVHRVANRASTPTAYSSSGNRSAVLSTACALLRAYYNDKSGKEVYVMALDCENKNRSYLFGRLLAIAEKAEEAANRTNGVERETNAMRYQSAFVQHPIHTWAILEKQLNEGYYSKLPLGLVNYFKNMISDIVDILNETDSRALNAPLEDIYLIGYYLQRKELNTKKHTESDE